MPYTGPPGAQQISTASHLKWFRDAYGPAADPKAMYALQQVWIRFAPIWPRITFLLESLAELYYFVDGSLCAFHDLFVAYGHVSLRLKFDEIAKVDAPRGRGAEPFDHFINAINLYNEKDCLLYLRWVLREGKGSRFEFLFREAALDVLEKAREAERKMMVEELLSLETVELLSEVLVDMDSGFWGARREIVAREAMMDDALKRLRDALDENLKARETLMPALASSTALASNKSDSSRSFAASPEHPSPQPPPPPPSARVSTRKDEQIEYGASPLTAENGIDPHRSSEEQYYTKSSRVAFSPPRTRSPSPPWGRRGRDTPALPHDYHHYHHHQQQRDRRRSVSRDSVFSATPSSIITWAPAEPDAFSISMKVFSVAANSWVEAIAIMDTGCEGGNFISSSFLEESLHMGAAYIEADPEGATMQFVDFAGKTDFKPAGKVRLRWYGREIKSGRRATRTLESEDWFRVAPHLTTESGERPFQILLGKDWLHDNEVLTYRGLRLFKSKERKGMQMDAQHQAELQRRQQLREEAEMERLSERLASDATSISTGISRRLSPIKASPFPSPRSSAQSISSSTTASSQQANGVGPGVDPHVVS